jgi:N,N-dimethylformamidase beta subunit-like protein/concanavalin A-like lectin/glucanase superfamily protein
MLEILGYGDRHSLRPGDRLQVKVSCEAGAAKFHAEVVRMICGDDSPSGPGYKDAPIASPANGDYPARKQPLDTGSAVLVAPSPLLDRLQSFTLTALVWPTLPGKKPQTLLARWSEASRAGFRLGLDQTGALALDLGDGKGGLAALKTNRPLRERAWYRVTASFDAGTGEVRLSQRPLAHLARDDSGSEVEAILRVRPQVPVDTPFTMAAHAAGRRGAKILLGGHFNGKIEAPRLAARVLRDDEIEALQFGIPPVLETDVIAAWDFAKETPTTRVVDLSANRLDGETVNLPTRAMKGAAWTGEAMRWTDKPEHYGAIHFHDDDLYDAGWETDFEVPIAADMRSGIYAVKLTAGDRYEQLAYVTFFVLPPKGKATAPVAFLAANATYMAYANSHHGWDDVLAEICYGALLEFGPTERTLNARRELGVSTYDVHSDGSGSCYSSRLRPILNTRPRYSLWNFGADLHVTDWLEGIHQPFDVITDEMLHQEGLSLLENYRCVVTGTHPEYHTLEQMRAVEAYLGRGGRLIYMGGNGFYWRIAWHPTLPGVIEMRRAENGTRTWVAEPGEYHLSFTGELSGLWRNNGIPPQQLVGIGFGSEGFDESSWYRRQPGSFDPRVAFIFEGIGKDEKIGDFGVIGGGAAGLELDIVDPKLGTPPHALVLACSEMHSNVYVLTPEELISTYPGIDGIEDPKVRADMVFFETPKGGAVFSTGSIAWAGSLSHNGFKNNVARITGNVLKRFIDPKPL